MSSILYYSNYCDNSKKILNTISRSNLIKNIHFLCIDKRIEKDNKTYIVLENNDLVLLPDNINAVPALLIINQNYKIIFGNEIINFLKPIEEISVINNSSNNNSNNSNNSINSNNSNNSNNLIDEPSSFCIGSSNNNHIVSDCYSFLDQTPDELSSKGNGGLRQIYNYATINYQESINTPPDNYVPDKIGEVSLETLQKNRNIN